MSTSATTMTAKLAAEFLLGQVQLNSRQHEPRYLNNLRFVLGQVSRAIGGSNQLTAMANETLKPSMHALVALLADRVTGIAREDTKKYLTALPVPHRMAVEAMVRKITGQEREGQRWDDDLFRLRVYLRECSASSPSGITLAEIRSGYDELLHATVDAVFERWEVLVA